MIRMYKIGVIGDRDTILAFKALGIDTFPVEDFEQARKALKEAAQKKYAVIFLTEQMAEKIQDTIDLYVDKMLPSIILIPNNRGSLGIGMKNVKSSVEKAIGVDIFLNEREGEEIETGKNH